MGHPVITYKVAQAVKYLGWVYWDLVGPTILLWQQVETTAAHQLVELHTNNLT